MREEQTHDDVIELGAASVVTLGEDFPTMEEGVDLEDRYV